MECTQRQKRIHGLPHASARPARRREACGALEGRDFIVHSFMNDSRGRQERDYTLDKFIKGGGLGSAVSLAVRLRP